MNLGKFMRFQKMSTDTKITDFCISIRGWLVFSFLDIPTGNIRDTTLIIFNRRIWEKIKD